MKIYYCLFFLYMSVNAMELKDLAKIEVDCTVTGLPSESLLKKRYEYIKKEPFFSLINGNIAKSYDYLNELLKRSYHTGSAYPPLRDETRMKDIGEAAVVSEELNSALCTILRDQPNKIRLKEFEMFNKYATKLAAQYQAKQKRIREQNKTERNKE